MKTKKLKQHKKGLAIKVTLKVVSGILAVFAVMCLCLSLLLDRTMSAEVQKEINYVAQNNASVVEEYMNSMQTLSSFLAKEALSYKKLGPAESNNMLRNAVLNVLEDDRIFSAYFAFEPDKFRDSTPKGLSYYAFRDGETIKIDVLNDYDAYSIGDYYASTKQKMTTYVTEPYSYQLTTGETVWLITLSNPIVDSNGQFLGIATCDVLSDTVAALSYDDGGYKTETHFVLTDKDTYLAHSENKELVGTSYSNDTISSKQWIVTAPIQVKGMDQAWKSSFVVDKYEAQEATRNITIVVGMIAAAGLLFLIAMSFIVLKHSLKPISIIVKAAQEMGKGNLNGCKEISVSTNDELGEMAAIFKQTSTTLSGYVNEISDILNSIANGDLNVHVDGDYVGDFQEIKHSLNSITQSLNSTFGEMNSAAEQVAQGSEQVSSGAQALSQGATEQASSIEELSATITEISEHVKRNAQNARHANGLASQAGLSLNEGQIEMDKMIGAMNSISDTSTEIGKIIKTIDDIAFQTNILALNAAVEAARAGEAGKGFAVVADEVRNLAQKSAEAAKNTTTLIDNAISAINNGNKIANSTAKTLTDVVSSAKGLSEIVAQIATASEEQANAITQVTTGVEQISSVVQTNSATAQESAATSEELSGQAQMLKNLISKFKLHDVKSNVAFEDEEVFVENVKIVDRFNNSSSKY